mmetsp:Transcript_39155/g.100292  ORF Transcript_39155/g.100292 Transcript_39155/m.100292 type:complete len:339 (-) Transcript_39155:310-1326(-)
MSVEGLINTTAHVAEHVVGLVGAIKLREGGVVITARIILHLVRRHYISACILDDGLEEVRKVRAAGSDLLQLGGGPLEVLLISGLLHGLMEDGELNIARTHGVGLLLSTTSLGRGRDSTGANEVLNGERGEGGVTVLAHNRGRGNCSYVGVLLLEGAGVESAISSRIVSVFHPVVGKAITEVGAEVVIVIACVRALMGVGSSHGVDVHISWEDAGKHRARFACFDVDGHLVVLVCGVHALQSVHEVLGAQRLRDDEVVVGEGDEARSTVIGKVQKDVVVCCRVDHSAGAHTLHTISVTAQDIEQVLWLDITLGVVLENTGVHIGSIRLIDDRALVGVG